MRQLQPLRETAPEPAWEMVRRWPGLRGEDKLAWLYAWMKSRGGRERITLTGAEIAMDQGTSSDAGRQRIKNLATVGLFVICLHDRMTGVYTVELPEPMEVSRARAVQWDPQYTFEFFQEQSPTQVASEASHGAGVIACGGLLPPRTEEPRTGVPRSVLSSESIKSNSPSSIFGSSSGPSVHSQKTVDTEDGRRGSAGASADLAADRESAELHRQWQQKREAVAREEARLQGPSPRPADRPLEGVMLHRLASLPTREEQEQEAEKLIASIRFAVNCPKLRLSPCVRIAWHVVEGRVPIGELKRLLANLDRRRRAGELTTPPSVYFNLGLRRMYRRFGLTVPKAEGS